MSFAKGARALAGYGFSAAMGAFAYSPRLGGWNRAFRPLGLAATIGVSAHLGATRAVMGRYPTTYTTTGFGSGFGMQSKQMPYDGGIGATGDLVLSSRTHGLF